MIRYCIDPTGTTVNWSVDAEITVVGDDVYQRVQGPLAETDPEFPEATDGEQIFLLGTVTELTEDPTLIVERGRTHAGWFGSAGGTLMSIDDDEAWTVDVTGVGGATVIPFDNGLDQPYHARGDQLNAQDMTEFRAVYGGDFASGTTYLPGIKASLTWPPNLLDEPHTGEEDWSRLPLWHGYAELATEGTTESAPIITVRSTVSSGAPQSYIDAGPMGGRVNSFYSNVDPAPNPDQSFWEPGTADAYEGPSMGIPDTGLPPGVDSVEVWAQTFGGQIQLSDGVGVPFANYGASVYQPIYNAIPLTEGGTPGQYFFLKLFDIDGIQITNPAIYEEWGWFIVGRDSITLPIYPTGPTQLASIALATVEDSMVSADCDCPPFEVGNHSAITGASTALLPGVGFWSGFSSLREGFPERTFSLWAHFEDADAAPPSAEAGTPRRTFQRGR